MNENSLPTSGNLVELTSDIVAAYVGHNEVPVEQMADLIASVFAALGLLGSRTPIAKEVLRPAVPIRSSVKSDYIVCLEDGQRFKTLKRHLTSKYQMTPNEYRRRWSLPADYPMVAPAYSERRKNMAQDLGLGRKPGTKVPAKRGRKPSAKQVERSGKAE